MKISGRKTSSAYELYGFIPKVENGKHSAICTSCNRVLQNTAAVRMQRHRISCLAARAIGDPVYLPNIEVKKRQKTAKTEAVQQNENQNANVKIEQSNMDFEDANINDNANDNTTYEDTVDATNPSKRSRITSLHDEMNNTSTILHKSIEPSNTLEQDENPIQSPLMTHPQPPEPFESYHAATTTTNTTSAHDIDDEIEEINDEDLIAIEEELDVIQNLMPRSKESKQLLDELSKAETEYYRSKTAYFTKLTENCKIKRTLMLLESRKLQLEIERLTNES
ncbi:uncharacterized protein LOC135954584 [Calliphora vicina]|uniref:uncharacterized protein LOC135954584 n=1 Tax=Calliphora vicina TaxID=7373 RepID=UPI00325A9654